MLGPNRAIMNFKFYTSYLALALLAVVLSVLALAVPAMATTAPVRDFQLPPAPSPSATQTPQVQGPVDTDGPVPVTPRVIPRSTPTPAPTQTPAPRPTPRATQPEAQATPDTRRFTPAARATPGQQLPAETTPAPQASDTAVQDMTPAEPVTAGVAPMPLPAPAPTENAATAAPIEGSTPWGLWLAILAGIIAASAIALYFWTRRQNVPARIEKIEPPVVRKPEAKADNGLPPGTAPSSALKATPAAPAAAGPAAPTQTRSTNAVGIAVKPSRLSRSMMNATMNCAITLRNRTGKELRGVHISGDLVTAHGKIPIAEQLCDAATELAPIAEIAALPGGQADEISANFSLPVSQIRTITQANARLYVPLLRLRIAADGMDAVTQTFVIGINAGGAGGRVQPFRLDEMPQTYTQIGSRPLD